MNSLTDQAALVIGYMVMAAGGIFISCLLLGAAFYAAYLMLTALANKLTQRLINLHGLEKVRRDYQKQEQGHE